MMVLSGLISLVCCMVRCAIINLNNSEETKMDESIVVNGKKYVLESSIKNTSPSRSLKGMKYVIVRSESAGVFAGYLAKREKDEVTLLNARRLWYWDGAASLSQLAMEGCSKPQNCKFPCEVNEVLVGKVIEVLQTTKKCQDFIASVTVWKA